MGKKDKKKEKNNKPKNEVILNSKQEPTIENKLLEPSVPQANPPTNQISSLEPTSYNSKENLNIVIGNNNNEANVALLSPVTSIPTEISSNSQQESVDNPPATTIQDNKSEEITTINQVQESPEVFQINPTSSENKDIQPIRVDSPKISHNDTSQKPETNTFRLSYENDDDIKQLMDLSDLTDQIGELADPQYAEDESSQSKNQSSTNSMKQEVKTPRARNEVPTPTPHIDRDESNTNDSNDVESILKRKNQHKKELEELEQQIIEAQREQELLEEQIRNSSSSQVSGSEKNDDSNDLIEENEVDYVKLHNNSLLENPEIKQEVFNSMAEEIEYLKYQQSAQRDALKEYRNMIEDQQKALELWSEYQKDLFNAQKESLVQSLKSEIPSQNKSIHIPQINLSKSKHSRESSLFSSTSYESEDKLQSSTKSSPSSTGRRSGRNSISSKKAISKSPKKSPRIVQKDQLRLSKTPTRAHSRSRSVDQSSLKQNKEPLTSTSKKEVVTSTEKELNTPTKEIKENKEEKKEINKEESTIPKSGEISQNSKSKRKSTSKKGRNSLNTEDVAWREFSNKSHEKKQYDNRFERLYNIGVEKRKLLEEWANNERKKQELRASVDIRSTPEISEVSRLIVEKKNQKLSEKDNAAWARLYDLSKLPPSPKRLKDINFYKQSQLVECTFEPSLSNGTNLIALKKVQSGERDLPAHEALFREAKIRNDVLRHIISEKSKVEMDQVPTSRPSTLTKEERKALFERLVNSHLEREKELEAIRQHSEQELKMSRSSSVGRTRSRARSGANIGDSLYKEGLEFLKNKKQKETEFEEELRKSQNRAFLGKASSNALEKLESRTLTNIFDKLKNEEGVINLNSIPVAVKKQFSESEVLKGIIPLLNSQDSKEDLSYEDFKLFMEKNYDVYTISIALKHIQRKESAYKEANVDSIFKPSLNPKSIELDTRKSSTMNRYLQLLALGEENEAKLRQMRLSLLDKQLEDCTFSPKIESQYKPKRERISLFERTFSSQPRDSVESDWEEGDLLADQESW